MKSWNVDHSVKRRCKEICTEDTYSGRGINYPLSFGGCQEQNATANKSIIEIGNPYYKLFKVSITSIFIPEVI